MKEIYDLLHVGWVFLCVTVQLTIGQEPEERMGDVESRDHHDTFMYAHVPDKKKYEFGYKRGNKHHWREHYEKGGDKHNFKAKVKWHDEKGGHGEHYWDYNHVPKYKEEDHHKGRQDSEYDVDVEEYPYQSTTDSDNSPKHLLGSQSREVPIARPLLFARKNEYPSKAKRRAQNEFFAGTPILSPNIESSPLDVNVGSIESSPRRDGKIFPENENSAKKPQLIRGFIPSNPIQEPKLRTARQPSDEAGLPSFAMSYFGNDEPELTFNLQSGLVVDEKTNKKFQLVLVD